MGRESDSPPLDRRLAALAGRLLRLHRGVFAVGHERLTPAGRRLAAVLACGPGAVLSHQSAASLWEIRASAASALDVTVPSQNGRIMRPGIRIHRSRRLGPQDVTARDAIPVTTVARTLLDLADVLPPQALKRAIDETENQRLFDLTALIAVVDANPGRRGKRLLILAQDPPHMTRSELEEAFLALVGRHGLPEPLTGVWLLGYEIDFLWPDAKLAVELDSWRYHGTRSAFQDDREKDRRLVAAGYRPIRITALDLRDGPALARELKNLLRSSTAQ